MVFIGVPKKVTVNLLCPGVGEGRCSSTVMLSFIFDERRVGFCSKERRELGFKKAEKNREVSFCFLFCYRENQLDREKREHGFLFYHRETEKDKHKKEQNFSFALDGLRKR